MRSGKAARCTRETDITVEVCLDGGRVEVSTGIGFFDHMLEAFAVHGNFGLTVQAKGDLQVDGPPYGGGYRYCAWQSVRRSPGG